MKKASSSLLILLLLTMNSCNDSEFGIAHQTLNEINPGRSYGKTLYYESLIRTSTNLLDLDETSELTKHIRYVLQYEIDTGSRFYKMGTDSIILNSLNENNLQQYAQYSSNNRNLSIHLQQEGSIVKDAVFIMQDSSNYQLFELVGDLPLNLLFTTGLNNMESIDNLINLDLNFNGASDSTNQ